MNSPSLNSKAPANSASQGEEGGRRESEHKLPSLNTSRSNFFIPASHPHFIIKWNELTFDSKKILSGFQSWTAIKAIAKWQRE